MNEALELGLKSGFYTKFKKLPMNEVKCLSVMGATDATSRHVEYVKKKSDVERKK